jgi:hypothetical protein
MNLGTGLSNTNLIISSQGAGTTYAAGLAKAYSNGGYSNWYLPSYSELLAIIPNIGSLGIFNRSHYWTSTEYDSYNAYKMYFGNNPGSIATPSQKNFAQAGVRAVRSF